MIDLLVRAEQKYDELDRSALGRFAVGKDVLVAAMAITMLNAAYSQVDFTTKDLVDEDARLNEVYRKAAGHWTWVEVYGESFLWMGKTAGTAGEDDAYTRKAFLKDVMMRPVSHHDYMAAGVINPQLIDRCIRDGIDPELAGKLA